MVLVPVRAHNPDHVGATLPPLPFMKKPVLNKEAILGWYNSSEDAIESALWLVALEYYNVLEESKEGGRSVAFEELADLLGHKF